MNATTFDTLEAAKELQAAGFSAGQAEALARIFRQAGQVDLSHLATKADLQALRTEIRADLAGLRSEMSDIKADIFKWLVPLLIGQAALTATLVKLL